MKRLNILFVLIFSCFSVSAQQNDPWQIVIDSCRNGSYSEVYPLARSLFGNDGLRYYVSVENSSTSCYIDRLNKGQYLVEYDLWVNASGSFYSGVATMQCLYAPEFRSNTPGGRIQVVEK